jgi:hypothetical protein
LLHITVSTISLHPLSLVGALLSFRLLSQIDVLLDGGHGILCFSPPAS